MKNHHGDTMQGGHYTFKGTPYIQRLAAKKNFFLQVLQNAITFLILGVERRIFLWMLGKIFVMNSDSQISQI